MADNKNPKVLNDTGDAYFYGIGRPVNRELAYTYYKQAADLDNPVGYHNLGLYFAAKGDYKTAILNYEKAKSFLHPAAFLALARMYETGVGTRKSPAKAFKMYLGAAKLSDLEAYCAVGLCYKRGDGTKKDPAKAMEWFQKAADQNDPAGCFQYGTMLMEEPDYKKTPEKAFSWLDKAAAAGHVEAMRALLSVYAAGKHPAFAKKSRQHLAEMAFYYRELLAKAGDVESLKLVAAAFTEGDGVAKVHHEKAAIYYKMLLDRGEVAGQYGYAVALLYGHGVKADLVEAKRLLFDAARARHPAAMTRLGDIARLGLGADVDNEEAKKWYMEAARLQEPEAIMNLGLLHYRGLIQGATPELAFNHMETAAKADHAQAFYWLGIFRDKGVGCQPDFAEAEKCFKKAIEGGSLGAKFKYASMLYDELPARGLKPKKADACWADCRRLFLEYVEDPQHNPANHAYSMYYLGLLHREGRGTEASLRRARYWFESAAEAGFSKAMVELYRMLAAAEPDAAREWLEKAAADPQNADALYEKGMLLLAGGNGVAPDPKAGRALLDAAARLNHKEAIAKVMLL